MVTEQTMLARTRQFAVRVMKMTSALPRTREADVLGRQLLRAGTSVGANYRAACRGRSEAEFAAKLGIVEEEADECCYWMELIIESKLLKPSLVTPLQREAGELTAIMAASRRTVSSRLNRKSQIANRKSHA